MPVIWNEAQKRSAAEFLAEGGPVVRMICPWFEANYASIQASPSIQPGSVQNTGSLMGFIKAYINDLTDADRILITQRCNNWIVPCSEHLGWILDGADLPNFIWHPLDMVEYIKKGGSHFKNHPFILALPTMGVDPDECGIALKTWEAAGLITAMMHMFMNLNGLPFGHEITTLWPEQAPMPPPPVQMVPVPVEFVPVQIFPVHMYPLQQQPW